MVLSPSSTTGHVEHGMKTSNIVFTISLLSLAVAACATGPSIKMSRGSKVAFDSKMDATRPTFKNTSGNSRRGGALGMALRETVKGIDNARAGSHAERGASVLDAQALRARFHDTLVAQATAAYPIEVVANEGVCDFRIWSNVVKYGVRYNETLRAHAFVVTHYTLQDCRTEENVWRTRELFTTPLIAAALKALPPEKVDMTGSKKGAYKTVQRMSDDEMKSFYAALIEAAAIDGAKKFVGGSYGG